MAKTWTKQDVNKMTSDQYRELYGNLSTGLTPDQEAFRTFVDGAAPVEVVEPGIRMARPSPRSRTEIAETNSFDPSFDEELPGTPVEAIEESVAAPPATVLPPAPVELPEQTYEYVITDDNGKQIGGKQVFKYRTQEELIEKLTQSNKHVRVMAQRLREEQLMNGTEVPAEATAAEPLVLRARLTVEERAAWEAKLEDPSESAKARYVLDRDDDRGFQNKLLNDNYENRVLLAIESFKNRNRDYASTQDNAAKLIGYVERRGLDPTNPRNYQKAYDALRDIGAIANASGNQVAETVLAPVPPTTREEKTEPTAAPAPATTRISEPAAAAKRPVAQIPTGISNNDQLSEGESTIPQPHWLTVRVYLKDGKGAPTNQFQEFHDLDAVLRLEGKSEKEFYNSTSPEAKARRAKYETALLEKETRLAAQKRKKGW
jgi:hypothetical protein